MAGTVSRAMPTVELVRNMLAGSGATGTLLPGPIGVRIAYNTTSTANAATNWINPEAGTVMAKAFLCITVAGTGTFDLGRGSDGTGNANDLIDGGTLTVGVHHAGTVLGTVAASATIGNVNTDFFLLGPGGSGTNNSINLTHSDTPTSTAAGFLYVEYRPLG